MSQAGVTKISYAPDIFRCDSTRSIIGRMPSSLEMASDWFCGLAAFYGSPPKGVGSTF